MARGRIDLASALAGALCLGAAGGAGAAEVRLHVSQVRSDAGEVLVALCTEAEFLRRFCLHVGAAPASAGVTEVVIAGVPPGVYAAQAVHDENGNRELDRNALGVPLEGLGFSRDAPLRAGPPRFEDAAVIVEGRRVRMGFAMRYF